MIAVVVCIVHVALVRALGHRTQQLRLLLVTCTCHVMPTVIVCTYLRRSSYTFERLIPTNMVDMIGSHFTGESSGRGWLISALALKRVPSLLVW